MKRYTYNLILIGAIIGSVFMSSCAHKVVLENDHSHPHIKKRHPHERTIQEPGPGIKP